MKRNNWIRKVPVVLLASGLLITATAWQGKPAQSQQAKTDTIPDRNKIKDIDDALQELEKGKLEMEKSMKDIDWKAMEQNIRESMEKIDMSKIQLQVDKAMKEVDFQKIQADIQKSLKDVDFQKMQMNMQNAMKQL